MKKALALVLALLPAIAAAQTFPTIPSQTVIGRSALGPGPAQAIPFTQLSAQFCANFTLTLKGCVPAPGSTTGRYLSDDIATPWKALPTQAVTAGTGVSLGGTCSGTSLNCQVNATAATQYVLPSRAAAAGSDLSALSSIMTLGYATPGDGGGATFQKVSGATPFIDSFISTFSIQGGSGCTNGSYGATTGTISTTALIWIKSGRPAFASGTGTVSGGALTAASVSGMPGNAWVVGDVLTPATSLAGCSVQPTITVTGVTTPLASFTDSAGNKWQFVPDGIPNVKQFGAKGDWNGVDASATNNFDAIQAAAFYATYRSSTSYDSGGFWGGALIVPQGSYMMCGSTYFVLPNNVTMDGGSAPGGGVIHLCDAYSTSAKAFTVCDPASGFACFGAQYRNMTFHYTRNTAVSGGAFMIYSNNIQDFNALYNVYVYSGQRGCFHFEKGYGGASYVGAEKVGCNSSSPNNPMIRIGSTTAALNYGSTIINVRDLSLNGPTSAPYQQQGGIEIYGGFGSIANVHCEVILNECIRLDRSLTGNAEQYFFHNINSQGCSSTLSGSGSCAGVITLAATNNPGNAVFGMIYGGAGYTNVINNGQPAGASYGNPIVNFARFNPSYVSP